MSVKIRTIKDIRHLLSDQLNSLYPEKEIEALTGIIIKTLFNVGRLHMLNKDLLNITPAVNSRLLGIVGELKTGKPVQYIQFPYTEYAPAKHLSIHSALNRFFIRLMIPVR